MFIQTHKLTLSDGKIITAKISAESPLGNYPVEWSGPVEALPSPRLNLNDKMSDSTLRLIFKSWARATGAKIETNSSGRYDRGER
jgi:hypothetical protein